MRDSLILHGLLLAVLFMIPFFTGFIGYVFDRARKRGRPVSSHVVGLFAAVGAPSVAWSGTGIETGPFLFRLMEFVAGVSVPPESLVTGAILAVGIWGLVRGYFAYYQTLEDALVK